MTDFLDVELDPDVLVAVVADDVSGSNFHFVGYWFCVTYLFGELHD